MNGIARATGLVLAAGTLMSVSPAPQQKYSTELLAMLDPTAGMRTLCGGPRAGAAIRARMAMVAAVVDEQAVPTVPLYDGIGKVHFPITTSSSLAQRYFDQGLAFAYGFNHSSRIAPGRVWHWRLSIIQTRSDVSVDRIDADRMNPHHDLTRPRFGIRHFLQPHHVRFAERIHTDRLHARLL